MIRRETELSTITFSCCPAVTLKGDPNSMIDLGTCSIFDRKGVADFLIENLMKTNRNGLRNKE